jgi:hypothetical protein
VNRTDETPGRLETRSRGPLEKWLEQFFLLFLSAIAVGAGVAAVYCVLTGVQELLRWWPARGPRAVLSAAIWWSSAGMAVGAAGRSWIMARPHNDDMRKPWERIAMAGLIAFFFSVAAMVALRA